MNLHDYMQRKRLRLHELAEASGRSITTVSRAKLGFPVSVASATAISVATKGQVPASLLTLGSGRVRK